MRRLISNPQPAHTALPRAERLEGRLLFSAGDLDPGFGAGGQVTTDFPGARRDSLYAQGMAVQADGKTVVVGVTAGSSPERRDDFLVTRFNPDGALDTTFGAAGRVSIDFGGRDDEAASAAIASDGKVIIAGKSGTNLADESAFAFVRLNSDGSLDSTFDGDGRKLVTFPGVGAGVDHVAVAADGSIAAAGRVTDLRQQLTFRLGVVRLQPDGAPDPAFGVGGAVETAAARERTDSQAIRFDADGRIVVAAYGSEQSGSSPQGRSLLLRYRLDGSLDPQFGDSGVFVQPPGANLTGPFFTDFTIDRQGRIILAGYAPAKAGTQDTDVWIARLVADGSFDPSFGDGGSVTLAYQADPLGAAGTNDVATAVFCRPDDSIVVAGTTQGGRNELPRLTAAAHISVTGQLDPSFGDMGWAVGGLQNSVIDADLAPDGRLTLLVGGAGDDTFSVILERFTQAGMLDPAFGQMGRVVARLKHGADDAATAVAMQADGKTIVAGQSLDDAGATAAIVRYRVDGSLDPTFGAGGRVVGIMPQGSFAIKAVALQPDGKIVIGGTIELANEVGGYDYLFAAARLRSDGSLDPDFGAGGYTTISFDSPRSFATRIESVQAMVLRHDGKIVLVGQARADVAMARLDSSGLLDPSFGDGGKTLGGNQPATGWETYSGAAAAAGPNDSLLVGVVYRTDIANAAQTRVVRYDAGGNVDPSFHSEQTIRQFINPAGFALGVGADGAIVVGGGAPRPDAPGPFPQQDFYLARYHSDGAPDTTFGSDGEARIDFAGGDDVINSLLVRPDGSILAAGRVGSADGSPVRSAVARISRAGALDPDFGLGGWAIADFGGQWSEARSISTDGLKIVTAGSTALNAGTDFAVARYFAKDAFVTGEYVFYNNSGFDGHDAAAGPADDLAISQTKFPLRGYSSGQNNITNYSKGINGLMFDVMGLAATTVSADDFIFTTGRDPDPSRWTPAPAPRSITIRRGAGLRGSDRVTLIWPDYDPRQASAAAQAIANGWLHIVIKAGGPLGLALPESYTIGNLVGETGGDASRVVNASDLVRVRNAIGLNANVESPYDIDHSGQVNATDLVLARNALGHTLASPLITAAAIKSMANEIKSRPAAPRRVWDELFSQELIYPGEQQASSST